MAWTFLGPPIACAFPGANVPNRSTNLVLGASVALNQGNEHR